MDGSSPKYFTRDFCGVCDYLFDTDGKEKECPQVRCGSARYTRTGRPVRQAYYFDLEDKVRRLYASKFTAGLAGHNTTRPVPQGGIDARELSDAWDADILGTLYHEYDGSDKDDILYLAQSNDGVEVQKNISYTPITAKLLNMPVKMRGTTQYDLQLRHDMHSYHVPVHAPPTPPLP